MLQEPWQITLCGALGVRQGAQVIGRFRTRKTGLLLAYLALHGERAHSREEVAELLWEDSDDPAHSLRAALSSLRGRLEPPGVVKGSVLVADRAYVRLTQAAFRADVVNFEDARGLARRQENPACKADMLARALDAIGGELLPGYYEDWVVVARGALAARVENARSDLVTTLAALSQWERALPYAQRGAQNSPLEEAGHLALMRLYIALGRHGDAARQYAQMTQMLRAEVGAQPSPEARALFASLSVGAQAVRIAAAPDASCVTEGVQTAVIPVCAPPNSDCPPSSGSQENAAGLPADTLPAALPSLAPSAPSFPLPLPLTAFFGRETECERICTLLACPALDAKPKTQSARCGHQTRLLTLLGAGGCGKTRLALQAANALRDEYAGGVAFAALADVTEGERICDGILMGLRLPVQADTPALEQVIAALSGKPFLLVLDNLEQIAEPGGDLAVELLARLPELRLLVTSRVRLNVDGERELPVLPLPTPSHAGTPERLLEFASVALFVDRAQAARADFQLTPRNNDSVAALCDKLEGIPLALELAAGWAQTLSPAQMLSRLNRRFDLLQSRRRGAAPRHQALQACIEWSYRLLGPDARAFFCHLSVFRNGWTLEAAQDVCEQPDAPALLRQLQEASFIRGEEVGQGRDAHIRFFMLETLREFGQEQLNEAECHALDLCHATYCLYLAQQINRTGYLPPACEQDNLRAALQWCAEQPEQTELHFSLTFESSYFWRAKGWWRAARQYGEQALGREPGEHRQAYARICHVTASFAHRLGDSADALRYGEQAISIFREINDEAGLASIYNSLGTYHVRQDTNDIDPDSAAKAQGYYETALEHARRGQNPNMTTAVLGNLGEVYKRQGRFGEAQTYMEECLAHTREHGKPDAWPLQQLAYLARARNDRARARDLYEQCLAKYRDIAEDSRIAEVLAALADIGQEDGETEQAQARRQESEDLTRRMRGD